jgi:hypothetical protein
VVVEEVVVVAAGAEVAGVEVAAGAESDEGVEALRESVR